MKSIPAPYRSFQFVKFCLYGFFRRASFFELFLLVYLKHVGVSYTLIGVLYATAKMVTFVSELPTGAVADIMGRKGSLLASFVIYMASYLCFALSHKPWVLFLAFIFYGVAEAFRSGTHKAMIVEYLHIHGWDKYKAYMIGYARIGSMLGATVGSLIGGLLVFLTGNYSLIFFCSLIPLVLAFILLSTYPKALDGDRAHLKIPFKDRLAGFGKMFARSSLTLKSLALVTSSALHTAYYASVKDFIQPVIFAWALSFPLLFDFTATQQKSVFIAAVYFFINIGNAVSAGFSGLVDSKFKSGWRVIPPVSLLIGLGSGAISGVLAYYHHYLPAILCFLIINMVENMRKPLLASYISDNSHHSVTASMLSLVSFIATIESAIIVIILGFAAQHLGVGMGLFVTCSVLVGFSLVGHMFVIFMRRNFD